MNNLRVVDHRKIIQAGASTGITLPVHHLVDCGMPKGEMVVVHRYEDIIILSNRNLTEELKIQLIKKSRGKK